MFSHVRMLRFVAAAAAAVAFSACGSGPAADPCAELVEDSLELQREFEDQAQDMTTMSEQELDDLQQRFLERGAELSRRQAEANCSPEEIERLMREQGAVAENNP